MPPTSKRSQGPASSAGQVNTSDRTAQAGQRFLLPLQRSRTCAIEDSPRQSPLPRILDAPSAQASSPLNTAATAVELGYPGREVFDLRLRRLIAAHAALLSRRPTTRSTIPTASITIWGVLALLPNADIGSNRQAQDEKRRHRQRRAAGRTPQHPYRPRPSQGRLIGSGAPGESHPRGFHRTVRDSLPSHGASHLVSV